MIASTQYGSWLPTGIYLITPDRLDAFDERLWPQLIANCKAVQWRGSDHDFASARRVRELCRQQNRYFIVNNDLDLAEKLEADGVHVGRNDATITQARQRLGSQSIIGSSCYQNIELAETAVNAGASYVSFGACFASRTKPQARLIEDSVLLSEAVKKFACPVLAIGGIDCCNFGQILDLGICHLAVSAAVFAADDPVQALCLMARHPLLNSSNE